MDEIVWFDGLGSALVGGVVAALVAVLVTRVQLNHDRRTRAENARDDAFSALAMTLAELRSARNPSGYSAAELVRLRELYLQLQKNLVAVARVAPRRDEELRNWLREFRGELDKELTSDRYRRGNNGATLKWVLEMAAQIEVRFENSASPLLWLARPEVGGSTSTR